MRETYRIDVAEPISEADLTLVRILYSPIITTNGALLYAYLFDEYVIQSSLSSNPTLLGRTQLLTNSGLTLAEFEHSLTLLILHGLIDDTAPEGEPGGLLTLHPPHPLDEFLANTVLFSGLIQRYGRRDARRVCNTIYSAATTQRNNTRARRITTYQQRDNILGKTGTMWGDMGVDPQRRPARPKNLTSPLWDPQDGDEPQYWETPVAQPKSLPAFQRGPAAWQIIQELQTQGAAAPMLWSLPTDSITPEMNAEIDDARLHLATIYPDADIDPSLAIALTNDTLPMHHAGYLLTRPINTDLETAFTILQAEGFSAVALNLIIDYAYAKNGVINTNFVVKISKNFIRQNFFDPLAIAIHLRKAYLARVTHKRESLKARLRSIPRHATPAATKSDSNDRTLPLMNIKKTQVISEILKNGDIRTQRRRSRRSQ